MLNIPPPLLVAIPSLRYNNPMRTITLFVCLLLSAAATADRAGDCEDLLACSAWTPQPAWLSNASPTAAASREGGVTVFRVDEPNKGMKWSTPVHRLWLRDFPFLVLRYRAANYNTAWTDYAVYLDDGNHKRQLNAIRPADLVADDQWHTLAVDVSALSEAETIKTLAVQVQATAAGQAVLRIERLEFADAPPPDAKLLNPPTGPARPERVIPLTQLTWAAQLDGLRTQPARACTIRRRSRPRLRPQPRLRRCPPSPSSASSPPGPG